MKKLTESLGRLDFACSTYRTIAITINLGNRSDDLELSDMEGKEDDDSDEPGCYIIIIVLFCVYLLRHCQQ
jgi:hypothetical protein